MNKLTSDDQRKIAEIINQKCGDSHCPCCSSIGFTLVDGYSFVLLQSEFAFKLTDKMKCIPAISIVCNNCGYMRQHAIEALEYALNILGVNYKGETSHAIS